MNRIYLFAALACATSVAYARPAVIEASARIPSPDPAFEYFARHVAVDGNHALLLGEHFDRDDNVITARRRAALWFERNASGTWVYKRKLADTTRDDESVSPALALRNGIAGFIGNQLQVFEYNGSDFVASPVAGTVNGPNLQITGDAIFGSDTAACRWDISRFNKVGTTWIVTQNIPGPYFGCNDSMPGSGFAFGTTTNGAYSLGVVVWPYTEEESRPTISISGQAITSSIFGTDVATDGNTAFVASDKRNGVYSLDAGAEGYVGSNRYKTAGTLMGQTTRTARVSGRYILQNTLNYDRNAYVVNVYEGTRHVAMLVGRNGASLGTRMDVSGTRVIVSGNNGFNGDNAAYVFELPATFAAEPVPRQDNFQFNNAANWTTLPGSQFSIEQVWRTKKWRQSSTSGNAGAVLNASHRTVQAVQADITRLSSAASDSWFGIATRYIDAGNHYYVALRASQRIELRKVADGADTVLASAALAVTNARAYRVQLVSSRGLQQVYVDGRKVLQAFDRTHTTGVAGIRMYRTAADYDNVVVTPGEHETVYSANFSTANEDFDRSVYYRGDWQVGQFRPGQVSQRSLDGLAIMRLGYAHENFRDQVIEARITPDAFGPATGGAQRYFGLTARGGSSYYALVVLASNQMQLRKVSFTTSGQPPRVTTLATATFTVPTVPRVYRLEAIGTSLRAFVDGNPMLEATDSELRSGEAGLITENAQASYDDFYAYQP